MTDEDAALRVELSRLVTEAVDDTRRDLDLRPMGALVGAMNDEDARVAPAVRAAAAGRQRLTMVRLGKTYGNIMIDVRTSNAKLRARALRTVVSVTGVDEAETGVALAAANGSAKQAVLALLAAVSPSAAGEVLAASAGHLRSALDAARPA